jgi:predicted DNA-binding transcriptional regulator YafY
MAQFDRIYQYKSIFSRKAFVPKLELLNKLEISEATFKRDLDKMRDVYNYEIVYDRYENAYKLNNTDGAKTDSFMTNSEDHWTPGSLQRVDDHIKEI